MRGLLSGVRVTDVSGIGPASWPTMKSHRSLYYSLSGTGKWSHFLARYASGGEVGTLGPFFLNLKTGFLNSSEVSSGGQRVAFWRALIGPVSVYFAPMVDDGFSCPAC